jgi:hypothetical protein
MFLICCPVQQMILPKPKIMTLGVKDLNYCKHFKVMRGLIHPHVIFAVFHFPRISCHVATALKH